MMFAGGDQWRQVITKRSVPYNWLAQIAKEISDKQVKIISRPSFRGYFDKVLYNLLEEYGISLKQYYAGYSKMEA